VQFTDTHPQQTLCAACHQRYFGANASSRSVTALVLGIIGLNFCWFLGIAAWWMAEQELAAIETGDAPMKGKNLAVGAKWLGIVQMALCVLAVFGGLIFIVVMKKNL
jgi:TRAP-type C4-dicarboxylate transport system permease small subunit